MKSHSSRLFTISVVALLAAALFLTSGSSRNDHGLLAGFGDVRAANAASVEPFDRERYAGNKAWEVIGGPVKAGAEPKWVEPAESAPMTRLPW
jgi:hypothetical protein